MIKFLLENTVTKRIIFGCVITKQNVQLLQENKPIHFNAEDLGMTELNFNEMIILYYETNEAAEKDLREKGYITEKTKIHDLTIKKDN